MITRRLALTGALAAAASAPTRLVRAGEGAVFRIGYQRNGILAVAKEQAAIETRLQALGVSVSWVEFSFGPPLLEALSLGSIDFGQTGDAPPIFAQAAKANLVYAAAQPNGGSGSAILLPKGSTIQSLAELKGKRVAFAKGSSAHNLTIAALEKAGLTYADIEPVTLAPADGAAAFARGSVDAWTVWDPYFAIAETGEGVRILAQASDITPTNNFFLANRTSIEVHPERFTATIDALGEVATWCEAHRGEVAKSLARITGVPLPATERTVGRIKYVIALLTPDVVTEQQRIADRFHALKIIPRAIRVSDIVWTPPGVARNNG
ncbi:aliphatic sulfonate ABC transporter substrate-binding protein [Methylobacterium brachythecii]|uniref:Putative aliphatic sulfonates-binding protein n=1 Tax=Methylobacterium brachythecii TaxID=1176177 RepID=A0A7W6AN38_9HYPH|nr:aliphatic sulfonate ABC transporter substrate-binding protein [Methylobacterium brachythecii]MBB3903616.1 sulfonate transport system substrate-binding protein [Methylobacterium brachythecii]GLS46926.1 sulfonate ABC transporter substrate-binding protein [Methylobacterium brachythecii]